MLAPGTNELTLKDHVVVGADFVGLGVNQWKRRFYGSFFCPLPNLTLHPGACIVARIRQPKNQNVLYPECNCIILGVMKTVKQINDDLFYIHVGFAVADASGTFIFYHHDITLDDFIKVSPTRTRLLTDVFSLFYQSLKSADERDSMTFKGSLPPVRLSTRFTPNSPNKTTRTRNSAEKTTKFVPTRANKSVETVKSATASKQANVTVRKQPTKVAHDEEEEEEEQEEECEKQRDVPAGKAKKRKNTKQEPRVAAAKKAKKVERKKAKKVVRVGKDDVKDDDEEEEEEEVTEDEEADEEEDEEEQQPQPKAKIRKVVDPAVGVAGYSIASHDSVMQLMMLQAAVLQQQQLNLTLSLKKL